MSEYLSIAGDVAEALAEGAPVVALESTVITHGMPWPDNLATARAVEAIVRENGAVPATVAVLDGRLRVGLDAGDLERLASASGVWKLSRADLPVALAQRVMGATTVAATMIAAARAGIKVFATGGIGGVHRGAETSFDISADLEELARTEVVVVAAGAKAVLDLPKTLEYLETRGVPVLGFATSAFPAFWIADSGLPVTHACADAAAVARALDAKWRLGLGGGVLLANPIPASAALPAALIETAITSALAEAAKAGVTGKAVTPYLLARVNALTRGRSLEANQALIRDNARVAALVAVAYGELTRRGCR